MIWLDIEILKDLLIELGGDLKFETPVYVKMTPHTHPIRVKTLKIEDGIMTAGGDISIEVSEPSPLCNSLIQRLKLIQANDGTTITP